ncbi:MAG: hypothetical protein H6636_12690 [Anaerolineales bacterium]|nr:hypothetical protein [Anaerolineales bacterium]
MLPPLTALFALALLLPGLLWQIGFGVGRIANPSYDLPSCLADLIGISLALAALVGLGTFLFGWRFSGTALLFLYGLIAAVLLVLLFRRRKKSPSPESAIPSSPLPTHYSLLITFLSLFSFAILLALRFYQSRTLVLPAWVDSVHHTLIVRLFLETGGVPPTANPYLPITFYYHFGFHLNAALFAFFTRLTPDQAVLIFGQFLNAFVSLAMYRLAMSLWRDPRRALLALLLTGFVSQMPAYYLTWGRYTLLTGLSLMLLAMAAALDVIRSPSPTSEATARLTLYVAGTLLTHYFAAGLLALFLSVLVLEQMLAGQWQVWKHPGVRTLFWAGFAGFLLASPWVWHVWISGRRYFGVNVVGPTESPDEAYFSGYLGYLWQLMGPYRGHVFLILGGIVFLIVGWRKRVRPFALWSVAFILLSLPWGVHIQPFRPDHGVIILFVPAGMMLADAFITPMDAESRWFRWLARGTFATALISLLIWGVRETRDILNTGTILATQADLHALTWIAENTPTDVDFFINVAYWQTGSYRGVDGGWWIMPLTGRRTFLPPALFLFGPKDEVKATNALAARAAQFNACTDEFRAFLTENKLTYVYLGANQGPLRPEGMASCPDFQVIYAQEGVTIYRVP